MQHNQKPKRANPQLELASEDPYKPKGRNFDQELGKIPIGDPGSRPDHCQKINRSLSLMSKFSNNQSAYSTNPNNMNQKYNSSSHYFNQAAQKQNHSSHKRQRSVHHSSYFSSKNQNHEQLNNSSSFAVGKRSTVGKKAGI